VVALAQSQFSIDAPRVARWHVPVKVAVLGGGQARAVIEGAARQELDVPGCGPVVVNAGQSTYARVRYSPAGLAALVPAFGRLGEDDQLGLLSDTQALALAGKLPMGELLALMAGVPASRDKPAVAQLLLTQLEDLDRLHDGLPTQPAFRAWAQAVLAPFLAEVGWDGRAGDSGDVRTLRVALIEALGEFGDPRVLGEVDKAFARYLEQRDSLDADHREAVLYVVATRADERTWEQLHGLALAAGSEVEKAEGYVTLGHARDPALLPRLDAFVHAHVPPATRGRIVKNAAVIRYRATVRTLRLPEADRWIAAHAPGR
jgi:aminopeptidase N